MPSFCRIFVACLVLLNFNALAVEKRKISRIHVPLINQQMNAINNLTKSLKAPKITDMGDVVAQGLVNIIGLDKNSSFKVKRSLLNSTKHQNIRYQQYYQDIPVWGYQVNAQLKNSNTVNKLHGKIVAKIDGDIRLSLIHI